MNHLPKLPEVIELIRPDDLLNLRIETDNLRLERDPPSTTTVPDDDSVFLVVDDPARPALLRVLFPPQHIAEFALFESDPRSAPDGKLSPDTSGAKKTREDNQVGGADKNNSPLGTLKPSLPVPGADPLKARIAAASRLVFRVPTGRRIPYTVIGLLDWRELEPVLHPIAALGKDASAAQRAAAPPISAPTTDQTALELPYRLLISPDRAALWTHRTQPFGKHGRYELWHTRLVAPNGESFSELDPEHPAPLRALWSPDYQPDQKPEDRNRQGTKSIGEDKAGRSALSDDDRHQLVVLTSAFHGYETDLLLPVFSSILGDKNLVAAEPTIINFGSASYIPKPFQASQVMLSSLGGWLKSRGAWIPPRIAEPVKLTRILDVATSKGLRELFTPFVRADGNPARLRSFIDLPDFGLVANAAKSSGEQLDLSEWVHVATQGRDHYVRVVYEGELWPFRHKAAMVKITERKFVQRDDGIVVACLVQRVFIVVREPEKVVFRHDSLLTKVRLTTLVTPNLVEPSTIDGTSRSFWINVGSPGRKFRFHAVGTDHDKREVDFTIPLIFASITDSKDTSKDSSGKTAKDYIDEEYNRDANRAADFQGAKAAFTPLKGNDNPLLATRSVYFKAENAGHPSLYAATVTIPALAELLGKNEAIHIAYDAAYASKGYADANNLTGVFARLIEKQDGSRTDQPADKKLPLGFRADQAGGFATPNQAISVLSREQGPVAGDRANAMNNSFDPVAVFPTTPQPDLPELPLLFGTFGLGQLLKDGSLSNQAPKITTERTDGNIMTQLRWMPQIKDGVTVGEEVSVGVAAFRYVGAVKPPVLDIHGETITPLDGKSPSSYFNGTLENFDIVLLDSVTIHFTKFAFTSRNGEIPNIKVALNPTKPLEFSGDLEFIEDLRNAIPPGLFGDGASLTVTAAGIRAGFSVGLPPLEIGVFALKDVSLGAALTLPFLDGKPVLDFNVSERANPFQLRVAFFAGGGFFHLQMDTQGMRQLEASLEFGAAFGLSIAVATGEVHAMAGIYFAITREDDGKSYCTLTGFMRLGGRLSVIGIIRLSVEFNLSFTYEEASGKAFGRATVTVMIEVLFISVSVALTVERAFGGASDPVFLQTFPEPKIWREYASAFA